MDRFIFKIRKETDKVQSNESANSTAVTPESSNTNLQKDNVDNSISACSSCDQQQCQLKESHRFSMFPAFYKAIQYFAVLPVTSCSCERAFSKLGHVKTKLRSTMSQQHLNSLMLLYIEQELALAVNYNEVIEEFKTLTDGERRLIL